MLKTMRTSAINEQNLFTVNNMTADGQVVDNVVSCRARLLDRVERGVEFGISNTDSLFVMVEQWGKLIVNVPLTGVKNIDDVITFLRKNFADVHGLVKLRIRNFTHGSAFSMNLMLNSASPMVPHLRVRPSA